MYNGECHKLIRRNSTEITRYDVCSIASKVYFKGVECWKSSCSFFFCKTRIYPFDPTAISNEWVKPAEVYDNDNDTSNTIHVVCVDCFIHNKSEKVFLLLLPNGFSVITLHANTGYTSYFVLKLTLQLEEVLNTSVNTVKMNFQKNSNNLLLLKWNVCLNLKFGMKFKHKRFYKIIIMKI